MSKIKWRYGPPPSVGWWPASANRDGQCLRWWNGKHWSWAAHAGFSMSQVSFAAMRKSGTDPYVIEWTDRPASWPERSRT